MRAREVRFHQQLIFPCYRPGWAIAPFATQNETVMFSVLQAKIHTDLVHKPTGTVIGIEEDKLSERG